MARRNKGSGEAQEPAAGAPKRRQSLFDDDFVADLRHWVQTNPRMADRLLKLVEEVLRDPFRGIGKPEPLKQVGGMWARRIDNEHRLTYRVFDDRIEFITARFHYE